MRVILACTRREGTKYRQVRPAGNGLVFRHHFLMAAGEKMAGLPASPLRMELRTGAEAPEEPCRVDLVGDELTLHFPSGNAMTFRRSSR